MKRNKSPCIHICQFTGQNSWCIGCGRTRDECKKWKNMKKYEISRFHRVLEKRLSILNGE